MIKYSFIPAVFAFLFTFQIYSQESRLIRLLILSGSNNHIWQETTPALAKIYSQSDMFHVEITNRPDNSDLQSLLLRGAEWAATGKVTQTVIQELKPDDSKPKYNWAETDTSFALLNGDKIIWQYNFNTIHGRPFFHPVYLSRNNMTSVSPSDHPWHLGQWFCWKYINNVNYWEYINKNTFLSDGVTDVKKVEIKKGSGYSAEIKLIIDYHPVNGEVVLTENRKIKAYAPDENGRIGMDYEFEFEAIAEKVELGRTPILGQPEGKSWGGYAGLSIRFNQDLMDSRFITEWSDSDTINGKTGNWVYMGFTGIDGQTVGSQIMISSNTHREGAAWYSVNTNELPFYYFSPSYLYYNHVFLRKGEKLNLKYKILHLPGKVDKNILDSEYKNYINQ